jgi:hypothetical protein
MRAVAPENSIASRGGTPAAWARRSISAALAAPRSSPRPPRLQHQLPVGALLDAVDRVASAAWGVSRTTVARPPATTVHGRKAMD